MSNLLQKSTYDDWITRLNSVRNKTGIDLSSLTLSIEANSSALSSQMKNLKNAILNMQNENKYLAYANYEKLIDNFNSGDIISISSKNNLEETVVSIESICPNDTTISNTKSNDIDNSTTSNTYENTKDNITTTNTKTDTVSNTTRTFTFTDNSTKTTITFSNRCSNTGFSTFSNRCCYSDCQTECATTSFS